MADIVIRDLHRRYGAFTAVDGVSLTVGDGEFLTLLGPSGCGKSTTLNILAGLDRPQSGLISVGGTVFVDSTTCRYVPAERRNIGLVFQAYALWPHMTVEQNVTYPLKLRKVPAPRRREMAREALALVEMESLANRYPSELSGGQQQRVALARTIVYSPTILLLDEPLSNLDAKLRERARSWLRHLQARLKITTVFVTHDQDEALALSDRIAVMKDGCIAQLGAPREIYRAPADRFVADFIGRSNFLDGEVVGSEDGRAVIRVSCGATLLTAAGTGAIAPGSRVTIACRPERLELVHHDGPNVVSGRITDRSYLGSHVLCLAEVGSDVLKIERLDEVADDRVRIRLPPDYCTILK